MWKMLKLRSCPLCAVALWGAADACGHQGSWLEHASPVIATSSPSSATEFSGFRKPAVFSGIKARQPRWPCTSGGVMCSTRARGRSAIAGKREHAWARAWWPVPRPSCVFLMRHRDVQRQYRDRARTDVSSVRVDSGSDRKSQDSTQVKSGPVRSVVQRILALPYATGHDDVQQMVGAKPRNRRSRSAASLR